MSPRTIMAPLMDCLHPDYSFQRESCMFMAGELVLSFKTDDNPGSVEFDFFPIWEAIKSLDPEPTCYVMIHTHPIGMKYMSATDRNMICGWMTALGRRIHYMIITRDTYTVYDCWKEAEEFCIEDTTYRVIEATQPKWLKLRVFMDVIYGTSVSPKPYTPEDFEQFKTDLNYP